MGEFFNWSSCWCCLRLCIPSCEECLEKWRFIADCFSDIDVKSLVVSGVTGAVGVGVGNVASKFAKVTRFSKGVTEESFKGKVIEELYQVSSDVGTSAVNKLVKGEENYLC